MLSRSETSRTTPGTVASGSLAENADQLLLQRVRFCLRLVLAGVALVIIGAVVIRPPRWPLINIVQAINFTAVAAALRLLRQPAQRRSNLAVGFGAYVVTILATGAVGILAGDANTPVAILVGMSVVTAALVPWDPWWQLLSVVIVAATAVFTVATVVQVPHLFWLQNVGAISPTLASTVLISHVLQRQRGAVERADCERRSREATLRDANRRLEHEIQQHRRTEDALRFAMRELDHRVKNTLATVQSVADQTVRSSKSLSEFDSAFQGRIQAMARIHTALAGRRWEGLAVGELIDLVVGPYRRHADSVAVDGADATFLPSELARVLGMALHELATNAAKYGALSTDEGRLAISSRVDADGTPCLHIWWSERGGPPVARPAQRGFGMQLIEEALAYEVEGCVRLSFPGEGLRCEIEIPVPA
jgi:two-component sensor histidine kinase